jgi:hypothetical protein
MVSLSRGVQVLKNKMEIVKLNVLRQAGYSVIYPFITSFSLTKQFKFEGKEAVMICNTKTLWEKMLRRVRSADKDAVVGDPFDNIVENDISELFPESDRFNVFYSHRKYMGVFIPFQRIAHEIGLAYFDPISHLSIHPLYGPWFSMRAIIVFNEDINIVDVTPSSQALKPNTLDEYLLQQITPPFSTHSDWRALLKVRDSISRMVGSDSFRFSDDQIRYHYTKDLNILHGGRF